MSHPSSQESKSDNGAFATPSFSLATTWRNLIGLVNTDEPEVPYLELESLEARVLYDASPLLAVAGENLEANVELQLDEIAELCFDESLEHPSFEAVVGLEDCLIVDAAALGESPAQLDIVSRQLVVIDERIEGFQDLVADITDNADPSIAYDVLTIGRDENGIEKISNYLNALNSYGAVHIVGHGSQDQIQLGAEYLTSESLGQYEDELKTWNRGLTANADILIYGCEVAGSEQGQELVDQIGSITGADVAASDDLPGNTSLGGDWGFEYIAGQVETDVAFSLDVQANWQAVLATVTVTTLDDNNTGATTSIAALIANDGGDGISLREAILAAHGTFGDDTIILGSGIHEMTLEGVTNFTGDFDIFNGEGLTIVGAADGSSIIDASGLTTERDRIFQIQTGDLSLRNLTLQGGYSTDTLGGGDRVRLGDERRVQ